MIDPALSPVAARKRLGSWLVLLCVTLAAAATLLPPAGAEAAAPSAAVDPGVVRATLGNGFRVVIVPNRLAPVVSTMMNYRVGADETPPGFPGMAHAQEHMMFRGSPGLSAEQLAEISAIMGGNSDADTRQTVTQYDYTVPAEDLDVVLHIEAIRMRAVDDDAAGWADERKAIEQEVAQDLSNPRYVLSIKLREAMFKGTVYEHDALGTRPSFEATTADMLKAFHEKWYAPNNALLVIAGDVDAAATLRTVKALFGPIPAKTLPPRPEIKLGPLTGQSLSLPTDLPYGLAVIAFRVPGLESPDFAALEVLSDVLSSQRGTLYALVPAGKALAADFSYDPMPKAGMAFVTLAFPAGGDAAALHAEARRVLTDIAAHGVPPALVEAAKRQERRGLEFQKNSIANLAASWSEAIAVDGRESPAAELAELDRVTVADVNRVARQYLVLDRAIAATLTPQGSGKPTASHGFGGRESIALGEAKPVELPGWAKATLSRLEAPKPTIHPVDSVLPNGIRLIVQPESISDTVSVFGKVRTRPELSVPRGQDGLSQVLDELFGYGTKTLDRIAFQTALDDIGADEQAGTDFSLQVLADQFERGVALLADNELHPALPAEAFDVVRRQVAQTAAGRLKSPEYLASHALRAALFPKGDPTLRRAVPATVESLTLNDVRDYYRKAIRPDLTTIVVIGKVTPERARAVIERYFGGWTAAGPKPPTDLPKVPLNPPASTLVPDASRVQDQVILAETLSATRLSPDYDALQLGNHVLGGAFYSTRLYRELRKNTGLVYYVGSYFDMSRTRGIYLAEFACDPPNVSKAKAIIVRELEDMRSRPVTAGELRAAKAQIMRETTLAEADVGDIARGLLSRVTLGLPLDEPFRAAHRYLALDTKAVQAAFAKYIRPNDLVEVTQGPTPH